VLPIVGPMLLQTVICQVNIIIIVIKFIVIRRGPKVALIIEVYLLSLINKDPYTDIEFSLFE